MLIHRYEAMIVEFESEKEFLQNFQSLEKFGWVIESMIQEEHNSKDEEKKYQVIYKRWESGADK